jgi:RND family efflux transporter MFP subunit
MPPVRHAAILTTLALGLAGCSREPSQAARPSPRPPKEVRTAEVVRAGVAGVVAVPGTVQARRRATLSARMPASVLELPYREGERVAAGAIVIRLDDAAQGAAVKAGQAAVSAAESDLERTKTLVEQGILARRELEQSASALSAARARLGAARDDLSYSVLRAPYAGWVAARFVDVGDVASPGTPLVEIEGEGGHELRASVQSEIAAMLGLGARLQALVDGQPGPLAATIVAVAPSADPTTHRLEVKADLPAASGLRTGLFARLLVPGLASTLRLLVPAASFVERGGLTGLFVVSEGRARLRWVAVGARDGGSVEVRAGIEAGERVVLDPAHLADGAFVSEQAR